MSGGGGAVRNVMPLHPSLLSCNREELYGKLLRSGGGGGPEIQINGLGREGRDRGREGGRGRKTAFC